MSNCFYSQGKAVFYERSLSPEQIISSKYLGIMLIDSRKRSCSREDMLPHMHSWSFQIQTPKGKVVGYIRIRLIEIIRIPGKTTTSHFE